MCIRDRSMSGFYCSIYNAADASSATSKAINDLILKLLLPKYSFILSDVDPLPTFALKLLSIITECNVAFIGVLHKLKLLTLILEYYDRTSSSPVVGNPRLNIHTVKIVRSIVEFGEIPLEQLNESNIISKTNNLISHHVSNQQDWCLDILLDIIYQILHHTFKRMNKARDVMVSESVISKECGDVSAIAKLLMTSEGLVDNFEVCMELLSSSDAVLAEKSVQVIFAMLQLFGTKRLPEQRQVYFIEEHMRHLVDAAKIDKVQVRKKALKCILFALDQEDHPLMLADEQKAGILKSVEPLLKSSDKSVNTSANKIMAMLSN
eukprot:TRINITY_DN2417_c0_g1_i1.p1 TRINITY_DN2417_c0_g1~~TRINITY_DN2417_c0_g1_i1.p1  ORF type:complete len:321 (+),score=88.77 TRINITY_DN2417_c0_g1_i1:73-1035(+)